MRSAFEYRVGDRVIALGAYWYDVKPNDTGRIVYIYDESNVGVEWDRYIGGHSCDGFGQKGYCTWEIPSNINIIESDISDDESLAVLQNCDELM